MRTDLAADGPRPAGLAALRASRFAAALTLVAGNSAAREVKIIHAGPTLQAFSLFAQFHCFHGGAIIVVVMI